ncbi:hypothetical protein V6Z11_D02G155500 [Gossypium hirsutum]
MNQREQPLLGYKIISSFYQNHLFYFRMTRPRFFSSFLFILCVSYWLLRCYLFILKLLLRINYSSYVVESVQKSTYLSRSWQLQKLITLGQMNFADVSLISSQFLFIPHLIL